MDKAKFTGSAVVVVAGLLIARFGVGLASRGTRSMLQDIIDYSKK